MFIKIKSDEIVNLAKILINNFTNVKNKKNLETMIYRYIANYYILSLKKDFQCKLEYNPDEDDCGNFFNLLIDDFNCFNFLENAKLKKEKIKIVIEKVYGGDND